MSAEGDIAVLQFGNDSKWHWHFLTPAALSTLAFNTGTTPTLKPVGASTGNLPQVPMPLATMDLSISPPLTFNSGTKTMTVDTSGLATSAQGSKADTALQNAAAFDAAGAAATTQAYAIQRANHTGSQAASTISDFNAAAVAANAPDASNALTGQSGAVSSVTAVTPGSDGTYRIGGYVTITAISVDVIQLQVTYKDETSTDRTQIFSTIAGLASLSTVGAFVFSDFLIRAKSGNVITIKTVLTTGAGSISYDVGGSIQKVF